MQVLLDRHFPEDRRLLRQVADAASRPQVHRQTRYVVAAQKYATGLGVHQADDTVKGRRFPGTIRSQEADHFTTFNVERNIADDLSAAIALGQPLNDESSAQRRGRPCSRGLE